MSDDATGHVFNCWTDLCRLCGCSQADFEDLGRPCVRSPSAKPSGAAVGDTQSVPFNNGLCPAEAERLTLLIEECGEVIQAASKVLRFGYEGRYGEPPETNRDALQRELGDLAAVNDLMIVALDVHPGSIASATMCKRVKMRRNTHHQGGVL